MGDRREDIYRRLKQERDNGRDDYVAALGMLTDAAFPGYDDQFAASKLRDVISALNKLDEEGDQ
jgi:hypothetical protein